MLDSQNDVTFRLLQACDLTASNMILSLLGASAVATQPKLIDGRVELTASELSRAAQLFGIETPAVRMALTRLSRTNRVAKTQRGLYGLGDDALGISAHTGNWRNRPDLMQDWNGAWRIVLTAHLGRSDRTAQRQREKALKLWGFVEAEAGIWVRPANLTIPLEAHRSILNGLGLSGDEIHLQGDAILGVQSQDWASLWPTQDLRSGYESAFEALVISSERLSDMSQRDAARECFLVGQSVLRCIGLDPLLPRKISGADLFNDLHTAMIAYDDAGRQIWRDFFANATPRGG